MPEWIQEGFHALFGDGFTVDLLDKLLNFIPTLLASIFKSVAVIICGLFTNIFNSFVEKNFRVKADRHNRAMCGLSMGGGQSWYVGLRAPEVFANIGVFSAGIFGGIQGVNFDLERECPGILTDTGNFNKSHDTFFVSCGEQDPRITYTRKAIGNMKDAGVDVTFRSYPGDHEWQVWRKSFTEYAQMLFK